MDHDPPLFPAHTTRVLAPGPSDPDPKPDDSSGLPVVLDADLPLAPAPTTAVMSAWAGFVIVDPHDTFALRGRGPHRGSRRCFA
jgi:hypothetical protein